MKSTWSRALTILLVGLLMFSLVACEQKTEEGVGDAGKLVIYSPNSEGLIAATIPYFEEKTGIKVELQQAGTGELVAKLKGEAADPVADVMFGGYYQYVLNPELFEPYTSKNEENIYEMYRAEQPEITSYCLDGSCLIVNKSLIGDIPINGYKDLLNPELKGKIACGDPANSSSAFAQLTNMLVANGGYESEEAWQFVRDLFTNLDGKIQSSSSNVYKMVADGEMVVGLTYEDPAMQLVQDGGDVYIVYPEEGTAFLPAGAAMVKNCKNRENAEKFLDYIASPEVQDRLGTETTNRPVSADAKTADYMTPLSDIVLVQEDLDYINSHKDEIVDRYKEMFAEIQSE